VVTASTPIIAGPKMEMTGVAAIDVQLETVITELFTVSDLRVSDAVLLDELDRVRVSATYANSGIVFNQATLLEMPPVTQLDQPGFARVLEQIKQNPAVDSGVYWDDEAAMQSA